MDIQRNIIVSIMTMIVFFELIFCGVFMPVWGENANAVSVKEFLQSVIQPTCLMKEAAQACWSPDGIHIAYSYMPGGEDRDNGGGILLLTPGQEKTQRLTADGKYPAWSPDGQWIAYVRAGYDNLPESIWLIRTDGSDDPRMIAEGGYPQWMPDGRSIVYHSRQTGSVCLLTLRDWMPSEKKKLFELSYGYPRLSPNGEELVFPLPSLTSLFFPSQERDTENVLLITDIHQKLLRQRRFSFDAIYAGWSPDGKTIAYGGSSEQKGLYVIDADLKSNPVLLASGSWNRPAWSPDGRYIVYDTMESGNLEIWILDYIRTIHTSARNKQSE